MQMDIVATVISVRSLGLNASFKTKYLRSMEIIRIDLSRIIIFLKSEKFS